MHPTSRAIARYHKLLAASDAGAVWAELSEGQARAGLAFGGRALCQVLRPHFLHPADFAHIARAVRHVVSGLHRLYGHLRAEPAEMIRLLALTESEQVLLDLPDHYGRPDMSTRMDAFWTQGAVPGTGRLSFLEYNSESPGGIAFGEALSELFSTLEPGRRFRAEHSVTAPPLRPRVYGALVACHADWCRALGRPVVAAPNIAIVDWRGARTRREFELSAETFQARGSAVTICDPAELAYTAGRLWAGDGFAVDVVYKRVVVQELIDHCGTPEAFAAHPLVRAALDGAVCVANGLTVQLLFSKTWFALLHDPHFATLLTADEQAAVRAHVPWTVGVADKWAQRDGLRVDLMPYLRAEHEHFVLKPAKDYGGRGVVLGWEVDAATWDAALEQALSEPHVAQAAVVAPVAPFPVWRDGLVIEDRLVDVDPYVWRGAEVFHGGVRLGTGGILNVTSGGGSAAPLWLVAG
jgi:hypothetical protein